MQREVEVKFVSQEVFYSFLRQKAVCTGYISICKSTFKVCVAPMLIAQFSCTAEQ